MSYAPTSPRAYQQAAVLAATPGELVVMLYDGARRFLREAAGAMRERDIQRQHDALRRAEMIISHLDATLDREQGEVAERLHAIYGFCLGHLSRGRIGQDPAPLEEVAGLLGELREAWAQIAREGGS